MSPLRLGIIGTGLAVDRLHMPALQELKDLFEVRAIAARNVDKTRALSQKWGIPHLEAEAEAILHRTDVDAVLISLPIELNALWARKALEAGKPVMAEKPIAANRPEAEELIQVSEQPGAPPLMIAENFLFWSHMAKAVELARNGSLGQIRMAVVHQALDSTLGGEWLTDWRAKPCFAGGYVLDWGVHWAALLNAMLGRPLDVIGQTSSFEAGLPPLDTGVGLITYENGTRAVWATAYSAVDSGAAPISVHGKHGSLSIYLDRTEWRRAEGVQTFTSPRGGYEGEWRHFHDVLTHGELLAYSPRQALQDLDLVLKVCGV